MFCQNILHFFVGGAKEEVFKYDISVFVGPSQERKNALILDKQYKYVDMK